MVALGEILGSNLVPEISYAEHFLSLSREILGSYLTIAWLGVHGTFMSFPDHADSSCHIPLHTNSTNGNIQV
jgi:hypothetical protein